MPTPPAALCIAGYELDWKTGALRNAGDDEYLRGGPAGLLEASWTRIPLGLRKSIQTWSHGDSTGQLLAFAPGSVWGYDTNSTGKVVRTSDDVVFASGARSFIPASAGARGPSSARRSGRARSSPRAGRRRGPRPRRSS